MNSDPADPTVAGMDSNRDRPRPSGINDVALEVDDVDRAIAFSRGLFDVWGVERAHGGAFVDLGEILPGPRLDFRDSFGNRVQVIQYDQIQFLKTRQVLRGMGLAGLGRTEAAELRSNGQA